MPQVMASDARQTVLFKHFRKALADIVRSDEVAERVDADHIEVLFRAVPPVKSAAKIKRLKDTLTRLQGHSDGKEKLYRDLAKGVLKTKEEIKAEAKAAGISEHGSKRLEEIL